MMVVQLFIYGLTTNILNAIINGNFRGRYSMLKDRDLINKIEEMNKIIRYIIILGILIIFCLIICLIEHI